MNLKQQLNFEARRAYVDYKSYRKQEKANAGLPIRFYNWWGDPHGLWLRDFIVKRNLLPEGKHINLCSVFGNRNVLYYVNDGPLLFMSVENLHDDRMEYADHLLFSRYMTNKHEPVPEDNRRKGDTLGKPILADLALGYDYFEEPSYLRFPLWMLYMFPPDADEKTIRSRCEQLRFPDCHERNNFAALVARYDWYGTRTEIVDALSHIDKVSCPGSVRQNDDSLANAFHDNKELYLRQFYFNVCPENSNSFGYVTEKVFEAISAGCIPVYWGSMGDPEPGILNKDAIIMWNMGGDNTKSLQMVEDLVSQPKRLDDFLRQPRLTEGAEERIVKMMQVLEKKVHFLLKD